MYLSIPRQENVSGKFVGGDNLQANIQRAREATSSFLESKAMHFDLNDAHEAHSWLRAVTSAFGRTLIGPGMTLKAHERFTDDASEDDWELLWDFYAGIEGRDFDNLSDFYPFISKLYRTAGGFRLFGQAAWELRRNGFDEVASYDVVPGFIWPNCDSDGSFRDPPFYQYLGNTAIKPLELGVDDIVIFMQPDFGTRPFATDFEALAQYTLPTDIYLATAMRSLLENWRTPLGIYQLHEHATQEDVDSFSAKLDQLYKGAKNYGKAAVVVRGEADVKTITPALDDLPFGDGHATMKDEVEGVSGVHGSKVGRTQELSRSNLRELRKDYWETTLEPIAKMLAGQLYVQVHQRIFGIREWVPVFESPDFLTQVEKATVGMRGRQWGALNTNEFRRFVYGMPALDYDWADEDYLQPKNMDFRDSPAEGEEPVDEPDTDVEPPERGDTDNTSKGDIIRELKQYASFTLHRLGKMNTREFEASRIPPELKDMVDGVIKDVGNDREAVKMAFDAVIQGVRDGK